VSDRWALRGQLVRRDLWDRKGPLDLPEPRDPLVCKDPRDRKGRRVTLALRAQLEPRARLVLLDLSAQWGLKVRRDPLVHKGQRVTLAPRAQLEPRARLVLLDLSAQWGRWGLKVRKARWGTLAKLARRDLLVQPGRLERPGRKVPRDLQGRV